MFKSMKASFVKGFTAAREKAKMTPLKPLAEEVAEEYITIEKENTINPPAKDAPVLTVNEIMDILEDRRVETDKTNGVGFIKRTINRIRTKYDRYTTVITNGTQDEHIAATDAKGNQIYNIVYGTITAICVAGCIWAGWYIVAGCVGCVMVYDMVTGTNESVAV